VTRKKILILGGGTAGFITATTIVKFLPNFDVELVYNPNNPVIGVGESTTPIFTKWCHDVGISFQELVKEIDSTVKLGIKFSNWNEDEIYYHPFHQFDFLDNQTQFFNSVSAFEVYTDNNTGAECFSNKTLNANLIAVDNNHNLQGHIAYHIDGDKFSRFLENKIQNKIKIYHENIQNLIFQDNILKEVETDQQKITADFFIDCTGLEKIIMKKTKNDWISKKDYCIMNSAYPIQIPNTDQIPPYTEAKAHDNGWMWKIPIGNRYGIGYVYNDSLTSDEHAFDDFQKLLKKDHKYELTNAKKITFDPGYYKEQWVHNYLPIGLSSGFVEPLESTNIHMIIAMSTLFCRLLSDDNSKWARNIYNTSVTKMYEQCFDFIRLHYYTTRSKSKTWKYLQNQTPEWIFDLKDYLTHNFFTDRDIYFEYDRYFSICLFSTPSYTRILKGLNFFTAQGAKKHLDRYNLWEHAPEAYHYLEQLKKDSNYIDHKKYLDQIKGKQ